MTEPTLSGTYDEIRRFVGRYLGLRPGPPTWSADETALVNDMIRSGQRRFYNGASWNGKPYLFQFLRPSKTLTLSKAYGTGTVTIVNGVVTLTGTGAEWPSWAAEGELAVDGVDYSVATRDDATQLTLDDTTLDKDAGTTFELLRRTYDLPDNFAAFHGPLTYRPGDSVYLPTIEVINEAQLNIYRQRRPNYTGAPRAAALRVKVHTPTTGLRWELLFDLGPDRDYVLTYRYTVNADDINGTNQYPICGAMHFETLLKACLASAEEFQHGTQGVQYAEFLRLLTASVNNDRMTTAPDSLGPNPDYDSDGRSMYDRSEYIVTYNSL